MKAVRYGAPTRQKVFGRSRTVATAEGKLADAAGKLYAHAHTDLHDVSAG